MPSESRTKAEGFRGRALAATQSALVLVCALAPYRAYAATPEIILRSLEDVDALRALLGDPETYRSLERSTKRLAIREISTRRLSSSSEACDEDAIAREHVFRFAPDGARTGRRLERRFVSCRPPSGEWSFRSLEATVARFESVAEEELPARALSHRSTVGTVALLPLLREVLADATLRADLHQVFQRSGEIASLRLRPLPSSEVDGEERRNAELQLEWRAVAGTDAEGKPSFITRWAYYAIETESDGERIHTLVPDELNEL